MLASSLGYAITYKISMDLSGYYLVRFNITAGK